MSKRRIRSLIVALLFLIAAIIHVEARIEQHQENVEYANLYDKAVITEDDLNIGANYPYSSRSVEGSVIDNTTVKYINFYGIEKINKFYISEYKKLMAKLSKGSIKLIITDKMGKIVIYKEVKADEFEFVPDKEGKYTVYVFGKKYSGKVSINVAAR